MKWFLNYVSDGMQFCIEEVHLYHYDNANLKNKYHVEGSWHECIGHLLKTVENSHTGRMLGGIESNFVNIHCPEQIYKVNFDDIEFIFKQKYPEMFI